MAAASTHCGTNSARYARPLALWQLPARFQPLFYDCFNQSSDPFPTLRLDSVRPSRQPVFPDSLSAIPSYRRYSLYSPTKERRTLYWYEVRLPSFPPKLRPFGLRSFFEESCQEPYRVFIACFLPTSLALRYSKQAHQPRVLFEAGRSLSLISCFVVCARVYL